MRILFLLGIYFEIIYDLVNYYFELNIKKSQLILPHLGQNTKLYKERMQNNIKVYPWKR
jgi:hypothetical protein